MTRIAKRIGRSALPGARIAHEHLRRSKHSHWHYRTGPKRVAFGVSIDESETVGDGVPRKQLQPLAPVGDIRLIRSVSEPRLESPPNGCIDLLEDVDRVMDSPPG